MCTTTSDGVARTQGLALPRLVVMVVSGHAEGGTRSGVLGVNGFCIRGAWDGCTVSDVCVAARVRTHAVCGTCLCVTGAERQSAPVQGVTYLLHDAGSCLCVVAQLPALHQGTGQDNAAQLT